MAIKIGFIVVLSVSFMGIFKPIKIITKPTESSFLFSVWFTNFIDYASAIKRYVGLCCGDLNSICFLMGESRKNNIVFFFESGEEYLVEVTVLKSVFASVHEVSLDKNGISVVS